MNNTLIGRCATCGMVNAIDTEDTPENRMEMEQPGRVIAAVTEQEASDAWKTAGACACGPTQTHAHTLILQEMLDGQRNALTVRNQAAVVWDTMPVSKKWPRKKCQQLAAKERRIAVLVQSRVDALSAALVLMRALP